MSIPRQTHCLRGHARTPDNINNNGACRTCKRERPDPRRQPKPATSTAQHEANVRGLTHYIQRRRQRLARQQARHERTAA